MLFKVKLLFFIFVCVVTAVVFKMLPHFKNHLYPYIQVCILALWALFFLFLLASLLYRYRFVMIGGVVCCSVFILVGTLIPGNLKMLCYHYVMAFIQHLGVDLGGFSDGMTFKTGHFAFFALFGLMFSRCRGNASVGYVACHIVMLAAGTEFAQFFIEGRSGCVDDFLVDCLGGMLGMLLGWLWAWMKNLKRKCALIL